MSNFSKTCKRDHIILELVDLANVSLAICVETQTCHKPSLTISNKNGLYTLLNEFQNDLTLYQENFKTTCNYRLVPSPNPNTKIFVNNSKKRGQALS